MRWADDGRAVTVVILAVAGTLLYIASRAAAAALAGHGTARAGWRAVGHWVPIAAAALVAAGRGNADVAVALAFATSVACLSFVLGVVTFLAPADRLPASRRGWPFVLPAALLALIAGFSGHITFIHAGAMLLLGGALLSVWRDPELLEGPDRPTPFSDAGPDHRNHRPAWFRAAELALAVALAAVGGWYAVNGILRASAEASLFPPATLTVVILSPLVTLPMLNSGPPEVVRAQTASSMTTLVAVALLNLCALLPLLTFTWYARTAFVPSDPGPSATTASSQPVSQPPPFGFLDRARPLPYPLPTWRVDAVVLTVIGFMLLPVSLGKWELRRRESVALIVGYAIYLVLVALASLRT